MQNHGLLTSGGTVAEAAAFFIALERACQNQLLVESSIAPGSVRNILGNLKKTVIDHETALYTKKRTGSPEAMYMQFEPEYQLVLRETNGEFLQ
jgi:ribulose-5-phosphate 4-epimerase/fuculose-1-phosphate aldolase